MPESVTSGDSVPAFAPITPFSEYDVQITRTRSALSLIPSASLMLALGIPRIAAYCGKIS